MKKYREKIFIIIVIVSVISIWFNLFNQPTKVIKQIVSETITETIPDETSQRELNKIVKENAELKARLKELKAKPVMIVEQEVVIEGRTELRDDIPHSFLYQTADGLTVASHSITNGSFVGTTYDLLFESKVVVSKNKEGSTYVHSETTITSSYSPEEKKVVTSEPQVLILKERPKVRFSPAVELELMSNLDKTFAINGGAYAGVSVGKSFWAGGGINISDRTIRPSVKVAWRW